jgi:hypothetical protein
MNKIVSKNSNINNTKITGCKKNSQTGNVKAAGMYRNHYDLKGSLET